jgi:hypothetical protein
MQTKYIGKQYVNISGKTCRNCKKKFSTAFKGPAHKTDIDTKRCMIEWASFKFISSFSNFFLYLQFVNSTEVFESESCHRSASEEIINFRKLKNREATDNPQGDSSPYCDFFLLYCIYTLRHSPFLRGPNSMAKFFLCENMTTNCHHCCPSLRASTDIS